MATASGRGTPRRGKAGAGGGKRGKRGEPRRPARAAVGTGPAASAEAVLALAQGQARTVVYIHGIGNKPPAEVLRCQWDTALFGRPMGERTRLAYWVDRDRYPLPEPGTCADRDEGPAPSPSEQRLLGVLGLVPSEQDLGALAGRLAGSPQELDDLHRLLQELDQGQPDDSSVQARGLGDVFNRVLLRLVSAVLLQDVHDFFYVPARREAMRQSLLQRLRSGGGPFVVVAHSQGSMIAYDVLRELQAAEVEVALFVTVGSPLGLPVVRSMFKRWTGTRKLPFPPCVRRWVNVAERRDPVALDADLGDDIAGAKDRFHNLAGDRINPDWQRNPHSGSGYLSIPQVRAEVRDAVGAGFDQPVSNTVLIKDLSEQLEARSAAHRHEVLIELDKWVPGDDAVRARARLVARLRALAGRSTGLKGTRLDEAIELEDTMQRFVSARLTRFEIEALRDEYRMLGVKRLWRDAGKRALIRESSSVIHADAAQTAYRALGQKIGWAVLDTGIAAAHPHFFAAGVRDSVVEQWDCTRRGQPQRLLREDGERFARLDRNGHGTHVAGIIAGRCMASLPDRDGRPAPPVEFAGIAPEAQLYGFKVLDDAGDGRDSWIIKGIQQVAEINERAGALLIHGVNLSLGGYFDPESYGCGFTPLCNELRRLWRQGVVVVLAAGNEGMAWLLQGDGEVYPANMDLSIGDPANLEEAIAVGSVHKSQPHNYGVSYFSSRGPTADGRRKPDVVAPGEKIVSAHHDFRADDPLSLMVEMSGTSMAAPHVAGLLAGFLSVRREFIGFPDRLKQLMLQNCTDLQRDPYMQGQGVPNLMRMLGAT